MKNFFLLFIGLIVKISYAQNTYPFPAVGNVGIGTTSPNSRLDLGSGYGIHGAKFLLYNDDSTSELSGTKCGFYMDNFTYNNLNLVFPEAMTVPGLFTISAKNTASTSLTPYLSIAGLTGNVGIGTTSPKQKLDVEGNGIFKGGIISSVSDNIGGYIKLLNPSKTATGTASDWTIFNMAGVYGNSLQFWSYDNLNCASGGMCANRFTIMDSGNVGIGTANPTSKLTVAGNIASREVKVTVDAGADFVFEKDYNLRSIDSVEKYIKENKHLPEIASAQEMQKDGINLSEMNIKLLQKIEEMTLYIIEIKKEIETLKKSKN